MAAPDPGFSITLNGLLVVWQLVGTPIIGAIALYIRSNNQCLRDIKKDLKEINGRVKVCETWAAGHEKSDDQHREDTRREFDQIRDQIHGHHPTRGAGP